MHLNNELKLDYSDVLIRPKRSTLTSRKDVNLIKEYKFKYSNVKYKGIPIMAANMDTIGTFNMAAKLTEYNMFTCIHKHYTIEDWCNYFNMKNENYYMLENIAVSTGISDNDFKKMADIVSVFSPHIKYIMIDVANGYTEKFLDFIKKTRDYFPDHVIMAGNVVTADMTETLILAGADVIKCGIGSSGICNTRIITGVGYPQLSSVIECANAAHGLGGHIIADGGCTNSGDVAKAFGANADFVMLGSMFAGHEECGGEFIYENLGEDGPSHMIFYGMSSKTAQNKHGTGLKNYRASEGRTVKVPYKGKVENTVQDILGGLRSCCTYVGANILKELPKRTTFIRVNNTHNRIYENFTIGN